MERIVRPSFFTRPTTHLKRWLIPLLLAPAFSANAQGVEWSEKDLARSVHRAEQTFKGGEMSRAYGLFAHLVSVAGDRAFLHYRFGATCTYTSQRLNEAIEHLEIARELGILETEEAAGWHYYKARYHHARFEFDQAAVHLRSAIDLAPNKAAWLEDAKLRFGQCTTNGAFPIERERLKDVETLVSHSDDYFRLYEMPVSEGRLLTIPEHLRTKEDKRRNYTSQLHWLPGERFAFYSSFGRDGDTGLDIYRVAVDGVGEYGIPEKLPSPVNSDFDDCAPVCMPGADGVTADRLFFSSSRPEALGGFDVFEVSGELTGESMELLQQAHAVQMPFEVNSTADEFLYWENEAAGEAWLTTNRNQDFEGREVWRFALDRQMVMPVAASIQTDFGSSEGRLTIRREGDERIGIEHHMPGEGTVDLLLAAGATYIVGWEAKDGSIAKTERIALKPADSPAYIAEPFHFEGAPSAISMQSQLDANTTIARTDIQWTLSGLSSQVEAAMFGELMSETAFAAIRADGIHEVGIEKVLQAANVEGTEGYRIPNWMLEAMHEIGVATTLEELPEPVQQTREQAVDIQSQMEETQCWDAPGTETWKAQAMIERFGEPALALLSEEVRQLRMQAQSEQDRWGTWSDAIAEYVYQTGVDSEDWNVLKAYCEAQFQAFAGAYVHAEDMFRRIDSHLRFERWVAEALPMEIEAFRDDLSAILSSNPSITQALMSAAHATHEQENVEGAFETLQTALWGAFTDEILEHQDLGIYTLPGMEKTQAWFMRSGGIVEELQNQANPSGRIEKGQQAVGLAWETCREGARRKDQVLMESEMSPGAWWAAFGPADSENQPSQAGYAGYELFVKHDDPILDQAHAYQEELDVLRTSAQNEQAYDASLKRAIAMRSSIEQEMLALFGGERIAQAPPRNEKPTEVTVEQANAEVAETLTAQPEPVAPDPENAPDTTPNSIERNEVMRYTVQIGAFANAPNFDGMPTAEAAFKLQAVGSLTPYGSGTFNSYEAAQAHLNIIRTWAADAFIKLIPVGSSPAEAEPSIRHSVEPSAPEVRDNTPTPEARNGRGTKQFRVRIVGYTETLQPTEVATLLRLGNQVPLKTARLSSETVYFTDTFDSLDAAKDALSLCIKRGFNDAEIEVLYE